MERRIQKARCGVSECNRDVSTTMMIGVLRLVAGFLSSVPMDVATIIISVM
jgi:hypothetical protein